MYLEYVESEKVVCYEMTSSVFFVTRNCQKFKKKNDKNRLSKKKKKDCQRKSSYLLNDLLNFNEIFRKDVAHDKIKSHKKAEIHYLFIR